MAYEMAKMVAFLCMALLVAHVESTRLLKQYDDARVTAETSPTQDVTSTELFAKRTEVPATEYNYNLPTDTTTTTEEASADEGVYATEGILVGETTSDTPPAESYVFDAQHDDGPVFNPDDSTTLDFDTLADQDVVQSAYDPTSLALNTQVFEFQETPDEDVGHGGGPSFFAFDDSLPVP